jgi:hypothetical protein
MSGLKRTECKTVALGWVAEAEAISEAGMSPAQHFIQALSFASGIELAAKHCRRDAENLAEGILLRWQQADGPTVLRSLADFHEYTRPRPKNPKVAAGRSEHMTP